MKLSPTNRARAAAAVLFVGALFYFVRPTDPVAVSWADHAGLTRLAHLAHDLRAFAWSHAPVPGWLRGSASDFAYALALGLVFAGARRGMLLVGLVAALGHELGQGLGWFTGTFDVTDLLVLAIGYTLGVLTTSPSRAAAPTSLPELQRSVKRKIGRRGRGGRRAETQRSGVEVSRSPLDCDSLPKISAPDLCGLRSLCG